jgi:hypothetical protein
MRVVSTVDELEHRLERMLESKEIDQGLIDEIMALPPGDPRVERVFAKLAEFGETPGPAPLNIEDHYRPDGGLYELRWPLAPVTLSALPFPFESLDRKTQFYVLFQEWTRRNQDATTALTSGDNQTARAIFEECLARAQQLDVRELEIRSYRGLASVASKMRDLDSADRWLQAAEALEGSE